jgi:tetratricopeptide (TPR) repeat protein
MNAPQKPTIISFYSYKGGVGRTQLLANLAAYLCYYKKKRVLLLDWDLEAPGLHPYLQIEQTHIQRGLIDIFADYVNYANSLKNGQIDMEQLPYIESKDIIRSPLSQGGEMEGYMDYFPPGNINSPDYHIKVADFNWYNFYSTLGGNVFIEFLKTKLHEMPYDYIFIDSRTGVNDYSGICNIQFPQINFVVVAPNRQNMEGVLEMVKRIKESPYMNMQIEGQAMRKPIILPILSRLDLSVDAQAQKWQLNMNEQFGETIANSLDLLGVKYNTLDYIAETLLHHTTEMAYNEEIIFKPDTQYQTIPKGKTRSISTQFENIIQLFLKDESKVLQELPDKPESYYFQGKLEELKGEYSKAIPFFQKATELKPDYQEAWFALGFAYYNLQQYELALNASLKATELKPDDHEAWNNLGVTYHNLQQYNDALNAYLKATELKPDYREAWYNLGITYHNLQQYELVLNAYLKATELKPDFLEAWYNLGVTYNKLQQYELALSAYLKATELKPDYDKAWYGLGTTYGNLQRYELALNAHLKATELKPDDHVAWYNLGNTYINLQQYELALNACLKATELKPDYQDIWYNLGITYNKLQQHELALNAYLKAAELKPDYQDTWYNLGVTYNKLQQYELALSAYLKATELKPDDHEAWYNLGITYNKLQQYELALNAYLKALSLAQNNANVLYNIACVYSLMGQREAALSHLAQAIALDLSYKQKAATDQDFAALWADEAFKTLISTSA